MVKIKKERGDDSEEKKPRGGSGIVHGTHETENSKQEKKVAEQANGSEERYGNEW